jgi:hypothetical protein
MRPLEGLSHELWLRLAVAAGAFALAFGLSALRIGHGAPDFYVFWTAARHWAAAYDPAIIAHLESQIHLGGLWPFAYPPTFLVLVWPFTLAPLSLAYPLWTGLEAALFVFAAGHLIRPVWATLFLAATPVVFFAAALGQTSLIVGAAMIGAWQLRDTRPALAGVLLGLAACIKPQALLMAPVVFWGRWRLLGWMAAAGVVLVAASLVFGWRRWLEWRDAIAVFRALAPQTDRINPSALSPSAAWRFAMGALGLYLALALRDLVGLVGGALCLTPYAHAYDLAPLAPVALAWLMEWKSRGWPSAILGGALLAGVVATPAVALAFLVAIAIVRLRPFAEQRPFGFAWMPASPRQPAEPSPVYEA